MNKTPSPKHAKNTTTAAKPAVAAVATDARHGQELLAKVLARKAELTQRLAAVTAATRRGADETNSASDMEKALQALETMLTGDRTNIDATTAAELSRWLETSAILPSKKPAAPRQSPAPHPSTH